MSLPEKLHRYFAADAAGFASGFKPDGTPAEILNRLLDASAACILNPAGLDVPGDELHQEILVPLLPAMLGDRAIRQHWRAQVATGFVARIQSHVEAGSPVPEWQPADFEIHVTSSYLAGPDAKALADTLLSEESLREMTAVLMNQVLAKVWPRLPAAKPAPAPAPAAVAPITPPTKVAQPSPTPSEPQPLPERIEPMAARTPLLSATTSVLIRSVRIRPHPIAALNGILATTPKPGWLAARARKASKHLKKQSTPPKRR